VNKYRPQVICINSSGGRAALSLQTQLQKDLIPEVVRETEEGIRQRREAREDAGDYGDYTEYGEKPYSPQVLIVVDNIARIFRASKRSTRIFPDYDKSVAAAVCLGRFIQEPLSEYCGLWSSSDASGAFGSDALFLDLHPLVVSVVRNSELNFCVKLSAILIKEITYPFIDFQ
jgi:hypothetical protein